MKKIRQKWLTLALVLIVLGTILSLIWREWDEILAFPWHLNAGKLLLVVVAHSIALALTFVNWHLMLSRLANYRNLAANFRYYYLSTIAKRIPTGLPFIGGRLYMYKQVGVSGTIVVNCTLLEHVLVGLAGAFVFAILTPFYQHVPFQLSLPSALIGGLILVCTIVLIARPQFFIDVTNVLLRRLKKSEIQATPRRRDLLLWSAVNVVVYLFNGLAFYLLPQAISTHASPGFIDALGISALAAVVGLLTLVLPGGFGLKELSASAFLTTWMPFSAALIVSFSFRLIQAFDELLGVAAALLVSAGKTSETGQRAADQWLSDKS